MAKSRMLARSISIDKELNSLSLKSQLIYTWCVPFLDDFGLLTNDCGNIKYLIFPRNPHITEEDIVLFVTEAKKLKLVEEEKDCLHFKGFTNHNPLTDYKKAKSEFKENRWNKGKSKYSPEIPENPPENPSKDKVLEVKVINTTVPYGTVLYKKEIMQYEEITYEPLEAPKKSKLGQKTMFVLVRAYLDAKRITLAPGDQYDANKIGTGLSKLYRECKKDPDETIRRIKLGGEYFEKKKLDWTPEAVWRRWEDIAKWDSERFNSELYE